jgi:multiple sugar transport system permease protein
MIKTKLSKIVIYMVLIIGLVFIIVPFVWMILTSIKGSKEVMQVPMKIIPSEFRFDNYRKVLDMAPFGVFLRNSIIATILITIGELITTILAAFAFSKLKFWGRDMLFTIMIATMMVPSEVLLIPNFITLSRLNWIDTYKALVIPWCASAFTIFLLRQYFLQIPESLYDAAKIDGCSDFKYLWTIMVPISRPALVSIAILKIVGSWNAFMWPLIVTNSQELRTLPVALSYFSSEAGVDYNLLMAASTMIIIPMVVVYVFLQKWIVDGVSNSGIKG